MLFLAGRLLFSLLVTVLEKSGSLNPVEASVWRGEHALVNAVKHLKTYQEFPTDKNGQ
jgi:hypothetical protein